MNNYTGNKTVVMVVDVESIGLHGEAFAVAWIVADGEGNRLEEKLLSCSPDLARGDELSRDWCRKNIPTLVQTHTSLKEMRNEFWQRWTHWRKLGAKMVMETPWPVDSRFLLACIDDDIQSRYWEGPFPLIDVTSASVFLDTNSRPLPERDLNDVVHHPLHDARHTLKIFQSMNAPNKAQS